MKKLHQLALAINMIIIAAGCTTTPVAPPVQTYSGDGVLHEYSPSDAIPAARGLLSLKLSVKTHVNGYYPLEAAGKHHGSSEMPVSVTAGGRVALWHITGYPGVLPLYDKDGLHSTDPEAGNGMMYTLDKTVVMDAGTCNVSVALEGDNITKQFTVIIEPGKVTRVDMVPVYRFCHNRSRSRSFEHGISDIHVKTVTSEIPVK